MKLKIVSIAMAAAGMAFADPPEGMKWETEVLQAQIDAAAAKGGGRVTVPKGIHPCRTLYLKSGVELHLEKDAVILGGTKPEDYDDALPLDQIYTYSNAVPATVTRKAFIFAKEAHGIAITGKGVIDNSGTAFFDHRTWAKPTHLLRPRTVIFLRCRDIRFEDTTFKDSPLWTMWLRSCENITVSCIRIEDEQRMINSDGIDFDGCRHVRVGDSYFKTGDDCVVLRAIRDERRRDVPVVTEDVVVSNCYFNTPCQGVRIGCPSDDTIRNAVFRNIEFDGNNAIGSQQPHRYLTVDDNGYLKTENILFENWTVRSFGHPLQLFVDNGIVLRDFGHMTFRNFNVKSKRPFMVRGNAASPVRDMRFENVKGSVVGKPFDITHASIDFGQIDVSTVR